MRTHTAVDKPMLGFKQSLVETVFIPTPEELSELWFIARRSFKETPCFLAQRGLFAAACWDKSSFRTSGVFGLLCGHLSDSHYRVFFSQHQLRCVFWDVLNRAARFTPKREPNTRMRGDPQNAKQAKGSCGLWAAVVTSALEYAICSGFANGCACRRSLMRLSLR